MSKPFNINIFMPDGDPNGMRIITRSGWTGKGVVCPRDMWLKVKGRPEYSNPGIYILVGDETDEIPLIYIGQTDELRNRINDHEKQKDFWTWAIVFISTDNSLNSALVQWLEYDLIQRAQQTKIVKLNNSTTPTAPTLREELLADVKNFSEEIYQIMPLVGLHCFSTAKTVAKPINISESSQSTLRELDTIIVPAQVDGFNDVFIDEDSWWPVRISSHMLQKIKYIAGYQAAPISAITHLAKVDSIVSFGDTGKYKIIFAGKAAKLETPIGYGASTRGTMQSAVYTSSQRLKSAKTLPDLMPFGET